MNLGTTNLLENIYFCMIRGLEKLVVGCRSKLIKALFVRFIA